MFFPSTGVNRVSRDAPGCHRDRWGQANQQRLDKNSLHFPDCIHDTHGPQPIVDEQQASPLGTTAGAHGVSARMVWPKKIRALPLVSPERCAIHGVDFVFQRAPHPYVPVVVISILQRRDALSSTTHVA